MTAQPSSRDTLVPQATGPRRRGLWFEEFVPGAVHVTGGRTITEADIAAFAGVSGDFNPLHTDAEFARRSAFRRPIAHGVLMEAVATGLTHELGIFDGTIAAFTRIDRQFVTPTFPGDTVHVRIEVLEAEQNPARRRGKVAYRSQVINQNGEVVVDGRWEAVILRKRTAGEDRA